MPQDRSEQLSPRPTLLKRRLYIVGTAIGIALCALYAFSIAQESLSAALAMSVGIMLELAAFFALFVLAPRWMGALEVAFFFGMVASLIALAGGQIYALYAVQMLSPDKLGFIINSLALWLTIYQLGAFLALPFRQVLMLLKAIWAGMALLTISAALVMRPREEWRYSYMISWVAGLAALWIVSLLIHWLGRRQQQYATTDALTGIANRHLFSELLAQHHEGAAYQRGLAMMLVDIDHFKLINDGLGHAIGDQVLVDVAAAILRHIRGADHVGRWGGDEFIVLLVDTDPHAAREVAERICAAIQQHVGGGTAQVTVSIGVHAYRAGQSSAEALSCADQALYAAKAAGRNQVCLWA